MDAQAGEKNRLAMKAVFDSGVVPGLIAFDGDDPVGWIQLAPREKFPRLESSRILMPVDDQSVWSVSCFFVHKTHRKQGVSLALLQAACDFAKKTGAKILEGYPIEPAKKPYPVVYAWVGFADVFERVGFKEVARRSDTRPIMRKMLV